MAVTPVITTGPSWHLIGLSSDTKPTSAIGVLGSPPIGSTFYETDTGLNYVLNSAKSWAVDTDVVHTVSDDTALQASNGTSVAYATNKVIKSTAGWLWGLTGYNSRTTGQFIQLHDAASLPADTTGVPVAIFWADGQSNFSIDFGVFGRYFSTGIVVCNSSIGPTKLIGSADCWFDAQYS